MRLPRLQFGLLEMLGLIALVAVLLGLVRACGRDSILFFPSAFLPILANSTRAKPAQAVALSFLLGMIGGELALSPLYIELAIEGGDFDSGPFLVPFIFGAGGGLIGLIIGMGIQTCRSWREWGRS